MPYCRTIYYTYTVSHVGNLRPRLVTVGRIGSWLRYARPVMTKLVDRPPCRSSVDRSGGHSIGERAEIEDGTWQREARARGGPDGGHVTLPAAS